ncbi:MAG: CDP-alcohol phosphatidyltransferase family protein [Thiohalophilus sp.]
MNLRQLPNLISILRILLVLPVVWALLRGDYRTALVLFMIAGLSDGLDGYLARRYGWITRLGGLLDPLGDKLLMVCGYLTLGWIEALPGWLVGTVIARDGIIVGGTLAYRWLIGTVKTEPLLISKINTGLQIVLVLLVILSLAGLLELPLLVKGLMYLVFVTTVMSGIAYVTLWSFRAWQAWPQRRKRT